jgi:hypothetical protein
MQNVRKEIATVLEVMQFSIQFRFSARYGIIIAFYICTNGQT